MSAERFAVVGTAGHIDHGKTALVRRLTGVDTDRLKEEKQRGISIDLGFAPLPLGDGLLAGVVDVPGHERFIRNMLAGVGGMDLVLLVVAADEGVMPQTREHAAILDLLHVPRCVAVLAKTDLVEPDYADMVEEELRAFLAGTRFAGSPVVRFSAKTGEGQEALLAALRAALGDLRLRDASGPVRMPVDRVFTMEGFGTVVTGTLWRGRVRAGDTVTLQPRGARLRVRSVESHGRRVDEVGAGRRAALALHPLAREDAARGDWVCAPDAPPPSRRLTVRAELLSDAPKALGARTAVRFHLGAGDTLAILRLLGEERLAPGASALAQLELRHPCVAERGDRFVLRTASSEATLGGGTVLEAGAPRVRTHDAGARETLARLERGGDADRVLESLGRLTRPSSAGEVAKEAGLPVDETRAALEALVASAHAVRAGEAFLTAARWEAARARVLAAVDAHQAEFALRFGIGKGELKSRLARELPPALFDAALGACVASGELVTREDRLARAGQGGIPEAARPACERVLAAARAAGLAAPGLADLAREAGPNGGEVVQRLLFERELVRLPGDLVFAREALEGAAAAVAARLRETPRMGIADFRDLLGLSRKYLVPLLEHFDSLGVTRREGETRVAGRNAQGASG